MEEQFKTIPVKEAESRLLVFLYKNLLGRFLLKGLIQAPVTKLTGWFLNSRGSKGLIQPFIKKHQLDLKEYEPVTYGSFNHFFMREIKKAARPLSSNETLLAAPCDGKVSAYAINEESIFHIKHSAYALSELLDSNELAEKWHGGTAVIFRLTPNDYHHYYFIDEGTILEHREIAGVFHTVQPIAVHNEPVFSTNAREVTIIATKNFGQIAQIEVGALMVGKIKNLKTNGTCSRFEKKGWFEFGGSTVILLFQENQIALNPVIEENTVRQLETLVTFGTILGKRVGKKGE
ncbi:archaetidylserine decarboxylase [Enterococcus sp. UD-01]|jgi:phosphatidylserine decarboxylase|uniref:archaetidylserine decarboxylase n=1 Tax=Enterococcus sp. UD-01 TaxID=3373911 RepID=UPI00384CA683